MMKSSPRREGSRSLFHWRIRVALLGSIVSLAVSTVGCGFRVPPIEEVWDRPDGQLDAGGVLERDIKIQVYCELKYAVMRVTSDSDLAVYRDNVRQSALPDSWGVQLTLNLQVDETTAINPGITLFTPWPNAVSTFFKQGSVTTPQSRTVGFGGTLSSQGTRIDKYSSYYGIGLLKKSLGKYDSCFYNDDGTVKTERKRGSSLLLESDLGIYKWLHNALVVENYYKSTPLSADQDTAFKQDVLSYEVKFIIISSGNVTPTWKLLRISANTGTLPLASANRTRTHDMLLTFGPSLKAGKEPGPMAAYSHLASEIGLSVANGVKASPLP